MNEAFSNWESWAKRGDVCGLGSPGVYVLAVSRKNLAGKPFSWRREIIYIGMTNSRGGLQSRLQQFDDTIKGRYYTHGGGERFRFRYAEDTKVYSHLYVSVRLWDCDVTTNKPADLRMMGEVARAEFECLALFVEAFGQQPEFNDKKRSPKK